MTTLIEMDVGAGTVHGDLTVPADATGVVVFAHGAGSSRQSPRNTAVARSLRDSGLATLLFDMLTEDEERGEQAGETLRFDIELLSARLLRMLNNGEFTPPNVFVLRNTPKSTEGSEATRPARNSGELTLNLKADAFPQQPNVRDYTVSFDPKVFDSPAFVQHEVGPYTVIVRR